MAAGIASRAIVGRGAEFAALARPLEAAADGRSGLVLVTGTSGVGVSRILTETARRVAGPASFRVAAGHPRPGRAADPYEPVLAALEPLLIDLPDAELARVGERGADVLARLLPSLADRLDAAGVLPEHAWTVTPERRQGRVFEALLGALERLGERVPVLLVLEDLHRADAATRAFTTFLARITRPGRWCVVASYQPDELTRDHPLRVDLETIGAAARSPIGVDVGPLDRAATAELIGAIEGARPSAGSLLLVWERSRGNPFLVEELVAARRELSGVDLAGSPEAIIAARLARRSPETRRILRLVAPAGERLSLDQLAAASTAFEVGAERPSPRSATEPRRGDGGLDGDLRAGLTEAVEHGFLVLRRSDGSFADLADGLSPDDVVELRHERIGRAVVADLLPTQRRRHHAALAVALDEHPEAATRHWLAARILTEARSAALRAAERAGGLDAPDDALARLELAIELGADADGRGDARTGATRTGATRTGATRTGAALLALAGELAYAGGRAARAAAYAESALARLDEKADRLAAAAEQIRLGRALRLRGDLEGSLVAQRRAVDLVPRTPSVERARVLGALAQSLMLDGHFAESERLAHEAIRTARAVGDDGRGAEGHAMTTLGISRAWGADPSEAPALLEAAGALAEAAGDLDERFRALNNRITTLHLLGRRDDSIALALAGIEEARRYGMETVYGNFLRGNVAEVLFAVGRWDEAAEMARTALEWSPAGPAFVEPAVFLATVRIEQRADEEAATLLGRLLLQLELFPDPQYVIPASRAAASFALWRGDVADAARAIALGWETVRRTEDWIQVAATAATVLEVVAATVLDARERRDLATVADARDQGARVLAEAERIVRAAGPAGAAGGVGAAGGAGAASSPATSPAVSAASSAAPEAAAWLATARADHARALDRDDPRTWAAIAKAWERVGNPYQVARARWRESLAILESAGDARAGRAKARGALLEAVRIARELGARPLLRELLSLATRALIRVPEPEVAGVADEPASQIGVAVGPGRPSGVGVAIAVGPDVRGDTPSATAAPMATAGSIGIAAALVGPSSAPPRDTFGLSNREREVLGLIVEGRTNREIGERLFISQKTVGVHVGNILAKLGVSGRVEAATVALRLELTAKG